MGNGHVLSMVMFFDISIHNAKMGRQTWATMGYQSTLIFLNRCIKLDIGKITAGKNIPYQKKLSEM